MNVAKFSSKSLGGHPEEDEEEDLIKKVIGAASSYSHIEDEGNSRNDTDKCSKMVDRKDDSEREKPGSSKTLEQTFELDKKEEMVSKQPQLDIFTLNWVLKYLK